MGTVLCGILDVKAPSAIAPEIVVNGASLVASVAWSPDGKTLVSSNSDGTLSVWDTVNETLVKSFSADSSGAVVVAWSPDSKTVATGDLEGKIAVWSPAGGHELAVTKGHRGSVNAVSWNPDGSLLMSGSSDGTLRFREVPSMRELRTLVTNAGVVRALAWSPDGKTVASGGSDRVVKLWDASTGRSLGTLVGHSDAVSSLAWSPNGRTLATGGWDSTVRLWIAGAKRPPRILVMQKPVWDDARFSRSKIISPDAPKAVPQHVESIAWSKNGKMLAVASGSSVSVWDPSSGEPLELLPGCETSVAWSPDDRLIACAASAASISIYDTSTGRAVLSAAAFPGKEWLAYEPDSLFFSGSWKGASYAGVTFDHQVSPTYPLNYYRNELMRQKLTAPMAPHRIAPHPIRYAWDNFQNKGSWLGGFAILYSLALSGVLVFARQAEPTQVMRKFFSRAGFERVEVRNDGMLLLHSANGNPSSAFIYGRGQSSFPDLSGRFDKIYVVSRGEAVSNERMQSLRAKHRKPIVPLLYPTLTRSIAENMCEQTLCELEEPFVARTDPYDESRPIIDPTWFYGRHDLLERLRVALRQGQHAGLFGLRKVGKTSLIHQLRARLSSTMSVWIDCQGYPPVADAIFGAILNQISTELRIRGIDVPPLPNGASANEFRTKFLRLYGAWVDSGGNGPLVLILDEADKLFPDRKMSQSDHILSSWVTLFRVLRSLAQERSCLSILATAYRPDMNRQNLLSSTVGENPMFMSFQEYFLGSLDKGETETMVREIGAWKDIEWSPEALGSAYSLCGGHPLVTRFFASEACAQGNYKVVDNERVCETAHSIQSGFHKHRIGRYYKESVWDCLQDDERRALALAVNGGLTRSDSITDAVTNLEQFGVIRAEQGKYTPRALLFQTWLSRG
jgi:WD40 repeat protein